MIISVLIPTFRPEGLKQFISSLYITTKNYSDLDICINDKIYEPNKMGQIFEDTYRMARGDWILFGNDDLTMETFNWDVILKNRINFYPDEIALFWPDDTIFSHHLACFPIVSKKAMAIAEEIWPMPYNKYKIDDSIQAVFPAERRVYIPEIVLKHHNDKGETGFRTADGRCYPNDAQLLMRDDALFRGRAKLHDSIRKRLESEMTR